MFSHLLFRIFRVVLLFNYQASFKRSACFVDRLSCATTICILSCFEEVVNTFLKLFLIFFIFIVKAAFSGLVFIIQMLRLFPGNPDFLHNFIQCLCHRKAMPFCHPPVPQIHYKIQYIRGREFDPPNPV